ILLKRAGLYIFLTHAKSSDCSYRPNGEIGRRRRLKISRPQGHAGSSPASGTIHHAGYSGFSASSQVAENELSITGQSPSCSYLTALLVVLLRINIRLILATLLLGWGTRGRVFESLRPDQITPKIQSL